MDSNDVHQHKHRHMHTPHVDTLDVCLGNVCLDVCLGALKHRPKFSFQKNMNNFTQIIFPNKPWDQNPIVFPLYFS
jgi:hypothetical protein